jgi:DNA circularisation protein N-terminus
MASIPSRRIGERIDDPRKKPHWRTRLRRATFKGVPFYVEQQGRSSGRRVVTFEYPKRDIPYVEDMGRHAIRYQMTGYLIQAPGNPSGVQAGQINYRGPMPRDYDIARDMLESALMAPGPGVLEDPYDPALAWTGYEGKQVLFYCERYSIIEQRERGGFCQIEMSFVEAGIPGNSVTDQYTAAAVQQVVARTLEAAAAQLNNQQTFIQNTDDVQAIHSGIIY